MHTIYEGHTIRFYEWRQYKVTRIFRGAIYEISITTPDGVQKGIRSVTLNGKAISGNGIPIFEKEAA